MTTPHHPHPGELLRRWREESNLTQAELAIRLGVGQQAISKWERGKALDPEHGPAIAEALGLEGARLDALLLSLGAQGWHLQQAA